MAIIKHIKRCVLKFRVGDYDNVLRSIPLVPAIVALVLLAFDVHRYKKNSALQHAKHTPSLILDVIALAFISATILWALIWCTILRQTQTQIRSWVVPAADGLLSSALLSLADPILSLRSSKANCPKLLDECSNTALNLMSGAGGMLILTSIPYHMLWSVAAHRSCARRRQRRKAKKAAEAVDVESDAITFYNEIK